MLAVFQFWSGGGAGGGGAGGSHTSICKLMICVLFDIHIIASINFYLLKMFCPRDESVLEVVEA